MSDDLREAVARALLIHRGLDPDGFFERYPNTTVVHDEADAAISAARPVIEAQTREACAKVADAEADKQGRIPISGTFAYQSARAIAAAIRGQP